VKASSMARQLLGGRTAVFVTLLLILGSCAADLDKEQTGKLKLSKMVTIRGLMQRHFQGDATTAVLHSSGLIVADAGPIQSSILQWHLLWVRTPMLPQLVLKHPHPVLTQFCPSCNICVMC
jgi:hypothetical protein